MHHALRCLRLPIAAAIFAATICPGWSAEPAEIPGEPKTLRKWMDGSVDWYKVFPNANAAEPAEALTVLRWANNVRGSEDGVSVLYVHAGRPLAATCIYPWEGRLVHDFESLSRDKIVARRAADIVWHVTFADAILKSLSRDKIVAPRETDIVWQPQTPGVTFADIPNAPAPEATRAVRLRQMKSLTEKFQATLIGWKPDSSDREELRLLSRPLFRYDPKEPAVFDGAVFAFVMGTDPEVLLLIEAVKQADRTRWQYAFARRTSGELEGRVAGIAVWKAPRFPEQNDPRLPHFMRAAPVPQRFLPTGAKQP